MPTSTIAPNKLRLVSYLAPNMFWLYEAVGAYLGRVFDLETQIIQSQYDPLSDPAMLQDKLDIAFICGLPFAQLSRIIPDRLEALVAPVMEHPRYQNCPVYFSDVIVNADSNPLSFNDLAGKTFCYNDLGSNSGYNLIRDRLLKFGHSSNFFGKVISSGSHQRSIKLVIDKIADCAAIDSTVLEQELHDLPELGDRLRIIESIGPCPIPPIVVAKRLGEAFIDEAKSALLQPDIELLSAMKRSHLKRYVPVELEDYRAISLMYDTAIKLGCEAIGSHKLSCVETFGETSLSV